MDRTEPTIGRRIRQLRGGSLTQVELAAAAGVSVDLIRKLEQGQRHTVSIASLHRIARALDVDTGDLLSKTSPLPHPDEHTGVVAIRRVLTGVDDLLDGPGEDADPVSVGELRRVVTFGWGAYWAGRYDQLGELLPRALMDARAAARQAKPAERGEAHTLAAQVHQVTACTLVHLGYPDAAFLALREGSALAAGGGDELRVASLRCSLAWLLLTQGRFGEAQRLAVSSAQQHTPNGGSGLPQWSMWGSLLLTGATAAGRAGLGSTAAELLGEAGSAAERTGDRNDYETAFGPAQVTMQTVDVHIVTDQYGAALSTARRMPADAPLPLAARARHLTDVALAHTRLGHDGAALGTLLRIEQLAPRWTEYQVQPRQVVRELLSRERRVRTPRLRELAGRLGVSA